MKYKDEIQQVHISFNKLSGARMGTIVSNKEYPKEDQYYIYKTCMYNPNTHEYVGDYETGHLIAREEIKPKIYEFHVNTQCAAKIEKAAPIHRQINAMAKMFQTLVDKGVLTEEDPGVEEFLYMQEYVTRARKNNELYKEARKNSGYEEYVSEEDRRESLNNQLAGGLNVVIGRG
jgi:hypothetical protein